MKGVARGLREQAAQLYSEALGTRQCLLGTDSWEVAECLNHLGNIWGEDAEDWRDAERTLLEALRIRRKVFTLGACMMTVFIDAWIDVWIDGCP